MNVEARGSVDRISFDYGVELLLSDGAIIKLEGSVELSVGGHSQVFSSDRAGVVAADLVDLLHRDVDVVVVESGELRVVAEPDVELTARPDALYEAWTLNRADGALIVCGAGGELHRWSATEED